jgi:phage baseplate assembly protein W
MPAFIGYSTNAGYKKFTLTDAELVRRDLLNAFNIRQGQLPGLPGYGTSLWDYIFEQQTLDTQTQVIQEVTRVAAQDPRVSLQDVQMFPWDNGMLIQLEILIVSSSEAEMLTLFFNQSTNTASYGAYSSQVTSV